MADGLVRSNSRIFFIENGAGPSRTPDYQGITVAQSPEWSFGEPTTKRVPSRSVSGGFDKMLQVPGEEEDPTLSLSGYYPETLSELLRLARKGCSFDVQAHFSKCRNPSDFNNGWFDQKVLILEGATISNWSTDELGTLEPADNDTIAEEVDLTGVELYEVIAMTYTEKGATAIGQEIVKILVCDTVACGDCDDPSDGCQKIFAISAPAGSSPGVLPEVVYSKDGLTTISDTPITTMAIGEDPDGGACVGTYLVVISQDSESLHYAPIADIIDGDETWTEVTAGFVASSGPRTMVAVDSRNVWFGGAGGYIYKSTNILNGVSTQDAASATTEDINDMDAWDETTVGAVADSNVFLITTNGTDWTAKTGPAAGVNLVSIATRGEREWWVGTAGGEMWYTTDQGDSWTKSSFSGDGSGTVHDIVWATNSVGFMTHETSSNAGRIFRTISGGNSWIIVPEKSGSIPANDKLNSLATCYREPNILYAGGLADDAADGIIIKGTS